MRWPLTVALGTGEWAGTRRFDALMGEAGREGVSPRARRAWTVMCPVTAEQSLPEGSEVMRIGVPAAALDVGFEGWSQQVGHRSDSPWIPVGATRSSTARASSSPLKSTSRDSILRNWLPWQMKGS